MLTKNETQVLIELMEHTIIELENQCLVTNASTREWNELGLYKTILNKLRYMKLDTYEVVRDLL